MFRYLHLEKTKLAVSLGQKVKREQSIGPVFNFFSAPTTIHLHFEIKESATDGTATVATFVPPLFEPGRRVSESVGW